MSELYSIQDTTLTAIGDAVRTHKPLKDGKTNISTIGIGKTKNANGIDDYTKITLGESEKQQCSTMASVRAYDDVAKIKVKLAYITGEDTPNVRYRMRVFNQYFPMKTPFTYLNTNYLYEFEVAKTETIIKEFEIEGNELTLVLCPTNFGATSSDRNMYFYAEIEFLDSNGNHLDYYEPIQVKNTMTPLEMADTINGLMTIPDEALTITGDCQYRFAYNSNNWLIETAGDKITTKDINNALNMFASSGKLISIPFEINLSSDTNIQYLFNNCSSLKYYPQVNLNLTKHISFGLIFYSNTYLREIPEWFIDLLEQDINITTNNTTFAPWNSLFNYCYSLRAVPDRVMKAMYNPKPSSNYYTIAYCSPFRDCVTLDELINIPCDNYAFTSNQFTQYFFMDLYRAKNITFATNEDSTPLIRNWKSQTLDLTQSVGYYRTSYASIFFNYNSGITADKEVKDDATYQALKNDPDWFATNINYSRYNHDSAVNTINSLPDCSASGGTNTIKFKGASGALTDAGAINTLTEEEIAVATAKGWTVSLV